MQETIFNVELPCYCLFHVRRNEACICHPDECVLRHYAYTDYRVPMTQEQREWCIREADHAGEGYYSREELAGYKDKELDRAVLNAWNMYVQSQIG
jgi:hypothetical protein